MTMQPRPSNPIEARKQAVRTYSRNTLVWGGGGLVGGVALGFIIGSPFSFAVFLLCLVVGMIGAGINYNKVNKVVNHRDQY